MKLRTVADLAKSENYVIHRVARDRDNHHIESYEDGQQTARLWLLEAALEGRFNPLGFVLVRHKREMWREGHKPGLDVVDPEVLREAGFELPDSLNPQKIVEAYQSVDVPFYMTPGKTGSGRKSVFPIGSIRHYWKKKDNKMYLVTMVKTEAGWESNSKLNDTLM